MRAVRGALSAARARATVLRDITLATAVRLARAAAATVGAVGSASRASVHGRVIAAAGTLAVTAARSVTLARIVRAAVATLRLWLGVPTPPPAAPSSDLSEYFRWEMYWNNGLNLYGPDTKGPPV